MAYNLTGVKPHVKAAAEYFGPKHGIKVIGGWRAVGSVPNSDHPRGLALDFMTRDKKQGDALAADVVGQASQWGVTYVIWWKRIWENGQWKPYSGTPNPHTDHVHVSYSDKPGTNNGKSDNSGGPVATIPVGWNPLEAWAELVPGLKMTLDKLTDPLTYRYLSFIMIGISCLLLGILLLVFGSAGTIAKVATKSVVKGAVGK